MKIKKKREIKRERGGGGGGGTRTWIRMARSFIIDDVLCT